MKLKNVFFLVLALCFSLIELKATITYVHKSGTVYSVNPGRSTFTSSSEEIEILIRKTDGRAETQVNVYVDNVLRTIIEFDNGRYTLEQTRTISDVLNREVMIEIVNQSVANTFSYFLRCFGEETIICPNLLENRNGIVYAGGPRRFRLTPKCQNLELVVSKTGGKAETQVSIYVDGIFQNDQTIEFDNGKYTATESVVLQDVSNKHIVVEIINQSFTNTFRYNFRANTF